MEPWAGCRALKHFCSSNLVKCLSRNNHAQVVHQHWKLPKVKRFVKPLMLTVIRLFRIFRRQQVFDHLVLATPRWLNPLECNMSLVDWFLLHNDAPLYDAAQVQDFIKDMNVKALKNSPYTHKDCRHMISCCSLKSNLPIKTFSSKTCIK